MAGFMLLFSLPFSYLPTLVIGILLMSVLRRMKILNVLSLCAGGVIVGIIVWLAFNFVIGKVLGPPGPEPSASQLSIGAVLGGAVALVFGLISGVPLLGKSN
jgi:hypothetical protein